MTLHLNTPHARPASSRLPVVAGRLTLVGSGLGALALIAICAPALWRAPQDPHSVRSLVPAATPTPQIWLSSLAAPVAAPFAAPDYAQDTVLPRRVVSASVAQTPVTPQSAPQHSVHTATTPAAPEQRVTPAEVPAPTPQIAANTVREDAPRAVPPQRQSVAAAIDVATVPALDSLALAALHAPTRSLMPRQRPQQAAPAPEPAAAQAAIVLASFGGTALTRSRLPRPRPETVTRLASLGLDAPITAAARTIEPRPLDVAPLSQAIVGADRCDSAFTRAIPRRPGRAGGGSEVIGRLTAAGGRDRDDAILGEVLAGNVPDFQRNLVPVTFTDNGTRVTICVTPDYLAVGSDRDFVRVPLGLPAAMRVAERFDMVLPTTRMVDAIYRQASVHLSPAPMEPGAQMSSTAYFLRHNTTVEAQRARAGARLGQLVSGHKKDLVLTNRLNANPGRVAIYGWHRSVGDPIQPLSTVHGAPYADYSHGIRLVSRHAFVNGRAVDLRDLLADSRLAGLVSSEGTITNRQMLAALN